MAGFRDEMGCWEKGEQQDALWMSSQYFNADLMDFENNIPSVALLFARPSFFLSTTESRSQIADPGLPLCSACPPFCPLFCDATLFCSSLPAPWYVLATLWTTLVS